MAFFNDAFRDSPIVISVDNAEKGNYIWSPKKQTVFLDDFVIGFYENKAP